MKNLISIVKVFFFSLLGFIPSALFGQTSEVAEVVAEDGKGLLWEISGNGLENSSYLFGTIHIISESDFVMSEQTENLLSDCEQVVLELDMDDPKILMGMMTQLMMKDGHSLKSLLTDEDYQVVSSFFADTLGTSLAMFEKMKPFMALSTIYPKMLGEKTASYEMEFIKMAKMASLEVEGLETVQDQLGIFDKIPYEDQAQMMVDFVKAYSEEKGKVQEMIDLYVAQDLKGLYEFSTQSPEMEGYQDIMLDNRNEKWIPKMSDMMATKKSFFAVGAGHLWGEKGVINLLREAGYELHVVPTN